MCTHMQTNLSKFLSNLQQNVWPQMTEIFKVAEVEVYICNNYKLIS